MEDEKETTVKKKKEPAEEADELAGKEEAGVKAMGVAANQGATGGHWVGGKFVPGAKAVKKPSEIINNAPEGLGAVAAANAKKRREQANALAKE